MASFSNGFSVGVFGQQTHDAGLSVSLNHNVEGGLPNVVYHVQVTARDISQGVDTLGRLGQKVTKCIKNDWA